MSTPSPLTVCACGRVARVHPLPDCQGWFPATDAAGATEAARARSERREAAYNDLRRAVAMHRLSEARDLIDQLEADRVHRS